MRFSVRSDILALLDSNLVLFLPAPDLLRGIQWHFTKVLLARRKESTEYTLNALAAQVKNLSRDSRVSFKDLWRVLRSNRNVSGDDSGYGVNQFVR
jgi:hypothetical protein